MLLNNAAVVWCVDDAGCYQNSASTTARDQQQLYQDNAHRKRNVDSIREFGGIFREVYIYYMLFMQRTGDDDGLYATHQFTFDKIFDLETPQQNVYEETSRELVHSVLSVRTL